MSKYVKFFFLLTVYLIKNNEAAECSGKSLWGSDSKRYTELNFNSSSSPCGRSIEGIYYFPSMIGLDPLNGEAPLLYDDYFLPIHRRDLNLISQATKYVRLPGMSILPEGYLLKEATKPVRDFLDHCLDKCLKVIMTFSLLKYQINPTNIALVQDEIFADLQKFVDEFKLHPAVALWAIGDDMDPFLGADESSTDWQDVVFREQFFLLLKRLYFIATNHKADGQLILYSIRMTKYSNYIEDLRKDNLLPANLDGWILNYHDTLAKDMFTDIWIERYKTIAQDSSTVILQINAPAYHNFDEDEEFQNDRINAVLNQYDQHQCVFSGLILSEWSDQWWKADVDSTCSSIKFRPFLQANCSASYHGLVKHRNFIGQHCIIPRPSLGTWQSHVINMSRLNKNDYSTWRILAGSDGQECVFVFPQLFLNEQALWFYVGLGLLIIIDCQFGYFFYRAQRRKNQNVTPNKVSPGLKKGKTGDKKEAVPLKDIGKEGKEGEGKEGATEPILESSMFSISAGEETIKYQITVKDKKDAPKLASNGSNINTQKILDYWLFEHLQQQKKNIEYSILHEEEVLKTLSSKDIEIFEVKTDGDDESVLKNESIRIIHARMLEGYDCWLEKNNLPRPNKSENGLDTVSCYGELLCFRLMVSILEHVTHCPERLAKLFHNILIKKKEKDGNVYILDMTEMFEGISEIVEADINFDDLNESSIMNYKDIRKTFIETKGANVLFDYLRDYHEIGFLKGWLFAMAWTIYYLYKQPSYNAAPFGRLYAFFESSANVVVKIFLFIYVSHQEKSLSKNFLSKLSPVITSIAFGAFSYFLLLPNEATFGSGNECRYHQQSNVYTSEHECFDKNRVAAIIVTVIFGLVRIATIFVPLSFMKKAKGEYTYESQMWGVAKAKGATLNEKLDMKSKIRDNANREIAKHKVGSSTERIVFWLTIIGATIAFEILSVVNLSSSLTPEVLCLSTNRCANAGTWNLLEDNICASCYFTVVAAWSLMLTTLLIDTPIMFTIVLVLWGYVKGQRRKLQDVYSTLSAEVDLTASGAQRKHMITVFGPWRESALPIWKSMIDSLYRRDLISEGDKEKLSTSGKKYNFAQLNKEARERLSFWLKTIRPIHKSMAANKKIRSVLIKAQRKQDEKQDEKEEKKEDQKEEKKEDQKEEEKEDQKEEIIDVDQKQEEKKNKDEDKPAQLTISLGDKPMLGNNLSTSKYSKAITKEISIPIPFTDKFSHSDTLENKYSKCWAPMMAQENGKAYGLEKVEAPSTGKIEVVTSPKKKKLRPNARSEEGTFDDRKVYSFSDEIERDWFLRAIPRLSHIITCYEEKIVLSKQYLLKTNGTLTNIEHLIKIYEKEWHYFSARFQKENPECFVTKRENRYKILEPNQLLKEFLLGENYRGDEKNYKVHYEKLVVETRLWGTFRAQTVARTIRGALAYYQALIHRLSPYKENCDSFYRNLHSKVELIVSHQTYGSYPAAKHSMARTRGWVGRRNDIEWVLEQNRQYPILLVYDWKPHSEKAVQDKMEKEKEDFNFAWANVMQDFWEKDEKDMKEYWENAQNRMQSVLKPADGSDKDIWAGANAIPNFKQATCIKAMVKVDREDGATYELKLIAVLPRINALRIGKKKKTQGKAANHLNALRAVSGHVIQVSDANMDSWIGEGYKLPWVTRQIMDGQVQHRQYGDRVTPLYRIIGFREYIFTGPTCIVGEAMASAEFTFGTLNQRVLADPLEVRMHYGHPDFFDAFWVFNRGALSKGSPDINLSEDVFAGYNVFLRGERIGHSDMLEWQKGRETVFTASSGFLIKISAGSVAIQRTRDIKYMQYSISLFKKMSLYFGGLGSFIQHYFINWTMTQYIVFFFLASFSGITLSEIELVGSSLGFEWLMSLGVVGAFGYLIEMMLEHGWGAGLLQILRLIIPSSLFYLHQNKCMVSSMQASARTGKADYVNTGRPDSFDHYTTKLMYSSYAQSHYYPALEKLLLYYFYVKFTGSSGVLPMFLTFSIIIGWIFVPVIFCPQIDDLTVVKSDIFGFLEFLFTILDATDSHKKEDSMDKMWRTKEQDFHQLDSLVSRFFYFLVKLIPIVCIFVMSFAVFIDYCFIYLFIWTWHICTTFLFFWSNYANITSFLWMISPIIFAYFLTYATPKREPTSLEAIFGLFMFVHLLRIVHHFVLLIASLYYKLRRKCVGDDKKKIKQIENDYKAWIKNCFFIFFQFHVHLYIGVIVFIAQSLFELVMMIIYAIWSYAENSWKNAMLTSRSLKETGLGASGVKEE